MSHLIQHSIELKDQPTHHNKLRKVTFHANHFSQHKLTQWNQEHQERQQLFLNNIAKKFALYQEEQIKEKTQEDMLVQVRRLRQNLRHTLQKENIEKIMGGNESKNENLLDGVMKNRTQFIDIGQKYGKKIQLKLSIFNEANRIYHQKQDYKQWYERSRNDPQHSPIASKISRIVNKHNKDSHSLRNTMDDQILSYSQSTYKKKRRNICEGNIKQ